jgi:inorganic phosphate transporter, PiT family
MSFALTLLIVCTVVIALIFDFINGFHDAANAIATVVSTHVLRPSTAVLMAAACNFLALFIFAPRVAETISQIVKIEPHDPIYIYVILTGLLGAILWDLLTWFLGLPTSSSHALIGGFAGAGIANAGWGAIQWDKLIITLEFIIIAPLLGLVLGYVFMLATLWIFHKCRRPLVNHTFRRGQLFSSILYSLGHGGNDAQKTMGIILALLIAAGLVPPQTILSLTDLTTGWVILSCHAAIALGTAFGGWRIVKTMGMRITKLKPINGFCAETAGSVTLFLSTIYGIPVSTTHTITGSIIGVGTASHGLKKIRWGVAYDIVIAWFLTIPAAGTASALIFFSIKYFA